MGRRPLTTIEATQVEGFSQETQAQMTEEKTMDVPNFHDGFFDGFRIKADKAVHLFLRTSDQAIYTLVLTGVRAMKISGVMAGNIILDIVVRGAEQMSTADMGEIYGLAERRVSSAGIVGVCA